MFSSLLLVLFLVFWKVLHKIAVKGRSNKAQTNDVRRKRNKENAKNNKQGNDDDHDDEEEKEEQKTKTKNKNKYNKSKNNKPKTKKRMNKRENNKKEQRTEQEQETEFQNLSSPKTAINSPQQRIVAKSIYFSPFFFPFSLFFPPPSSYKKIYKAEKASTFPVSDYFRCQTTEYEDSSGRRFSHIICFVSLDGSDDKEVER